VIVYLFRLNGVLCVHLWTAVTDAPAGHVTLGANMANGIEQKGIDTLQQCIKKCAAAGLGIPATVSVSTDTFRSQRNICRVNDRRT